jgi:hypothetical protein
MREAGLRSFEAGPPFDSVLYAIEFADTVIQIDGATGIEYAEWSGDTPKCRGISDRLADAISIFSTVARYDTTKHLREYIVPLWKTRGYDRHVLVKRFSWTEEQEVQLEKDLRAIAHALCIAGFLVPCKASSSACWRKHDKNKVCTRG